MNWPADKVVRRSLAELIPYARNSRTHSAEQIAQIAASIQEWGWTVPVLVDGDGVLIAGHGRVLAAQRLGITEIPTMTATGWTAEQIQAYRIADNKLGINAGWDDELLRQELGELRDDGFDLALIGFDDLELSEMFADETEGLTDPDDVPEAPAEPVTRLGDVWLLGAKAMCPKCGKATAVGLGPHKRPGQP
jgi:ParB-like chromosome segregation protein Spo0J